MVYHLQESTSLPVAYMIPCVRLVWVVRLLVYFFQSCNTRYGWLAIPYPAGTLTLQETPGLPWRAHVLELGELKKMHYAELKKNPVSTFKTLASWRAFFLPKPIGFLPERDFGTNLIFKRQRPPGHTF
jgi:hypothetical protein